MNKDIAEHILVLEEYMKAQRELVELVGETPEDEFELNSYEVRVMEVESKFERLSEMLNESINRIARIE